MQITFIKTYFNADIIMLKIQILKTYRYFYKFWFAKVYSNKIILKLCQPLKIFTETYFTITKSKNRTQ